MLERCAALLGLVLLLVVATACGEDRPLADRIRAGETIRVGFANEEPYAYLDDSGELTGEAPEVAREILSRIAGSDAEPEIEGVLTDFGALIPGLQAGRFDVIAAGMYITPERAQEIAFTDPTYSIGESFMVRAGNPHDLHSYEDVAENAEVKLGVVAGAVQQGYARDVGIPDDQVVVFPSAQDAVAGLQSERIDAYAGTSLTVSKLMDQAADDRLEIAAPMEDLVIDGEVVRGYGAFGLRKTDADVVETFNAELDGFIGSPEHLDLVEPFGFGETELPGDVTAEELSRQ